MHNAFVITPSIPFLFLYSYLVSGLPHNYQEMKDMRDSNDFDKELVELLKLCRKALEKIIGDEKK